MPMWTAAASAQPNTSRGDGEEVEQDRAAFDYSLAPPWKGAMLWPVSNTSASMILGDR